MWQSIHEAGKQLALTVPAIRRLHAQRDQLAESLAAATARLAEQAVTSPTNVAASTASALDRYTSAPPAPENAFRQFAGEWISRVPGFETGSVALFDDHRIRWLQSQLGGFAGKRVLELGPLEAGHTFMMERAGANVLAIEANQRAFLKCLIVKQAFDLRARFLLGDAHAYLKTCPDRFDFVLASGILYHMNTPAEFLRDVGRVAHSLGVWSHYYDPAIVDSRADLRDKFEREPTIETSSGIAVTSFLRHYGSELRSPEFCGGSLPTSRWLTKDSLFDLLDALGFLTTIGEDAPDHPNGPAILLFARARDAV